MARAFLDVFDQELVRLRNDLKAVGRGHLALVGSAGGGPRSVGATPYPVPPTDAR
jgi:hypothetical protein